MRRGIFFYPKMAAANIQKNSRMYLPYILTCVITAAMYFMIHSLADNPGLSQVMGGSTVAYSLGMGTHVTALFAVIFLFYTNSFLMKRRKKEFALYNILGMEKRHLGRVIFCETVDTAFLTLVFGLGLGLLFNRLLFLVIVRLLGVESPLSFRISPGAVRDTCILFLVIFLFMFLNGVRQISFKSPMELMQEGRAGEREPKTRWLLVLTGVLTLGAGYYMAVTIKNPIAAVAMFFGAVFLVIIGTYCLFTAGSIALLKLLRRRKRYYYKAEHFISVSGMLYRMKQNAVGLANICILSTMVLVMVSSSLCLYWGIQDMMDLRYPRQIMITSGSYSEADEETIRARTGSLLEEMGLSASHELSYRYTSFSAVERGNAYELGDSGDLMDMNRLRQVYVMTLEDYDRLTGQEHVLEDGQILFWKRGEAPASIEIFGQEYPVKSPAENILDEIGISFGGAENVLAVVKDEAVFEEWNRLQAEAYGENASSPDYVFGFDLEAAGAEAQTAFGNRLNHSLAGAPQDGGAGLDLSVDCEAEGEESSYSLFGGLFFIGIFLGLLFVMATVLIIYYKQISEGYEDKERYEILKKVGMSRREILRSIHSQVLTVFFLPLIGAGIHVAFAFPFVTRVLSALSMTNVRLFALCTAGTIGVFALFYLAVYRLTARAYYRIVR